MRVTAAKSLERENVCDSSAEGWPVVGLEFHSVGAGRDPTRLSFCGAIFLFRRLLALFLGTVKIISRVM